MIKSPRSIIISDTLYFHWSYARELALTLILLASLGASGLGFLIGYLFHRFISSSCA